MVGAHLRRVREAAVTRVPELDREQEPSIFDHDQERALPAVALLSETWWPTEELQGHLRHRRSVFGWRRRRAHRACQHLIARRETEVGLRRRSSVEIVMR